MLEKMNEEKLSKLFTARYDYTFSFDVDSNRPIGIKALLAKLKKDFIVVEEDTLKENNIGIGDIFQDLVGLVKQAPENVIALYWLAWCYQHGGGTEQDFEIANEYYFRAANLGCDISMLHLGLMHELGLGGAEKNINIAAQWYLNAAKCNNKYSNGTLLALECLEYLNKRKYFYKDAASALGDCYFYGYGVDVNYWRASYYYGRILAHASSNPNISELDPTAAIAALHKLAKLGKKRAVNHLIKYYYEVYVNKVPSVAKLDIDQIYDLFLSTALSTADEWSVKGLIAIIDQHYQEYGAAKSLEKTAQRFLEEAESNNKTAQLCLGEFIKRLTVKTYNASDMELYIVGRVHECGYGVKLDLDKAIDYYVAAVECPMSRYTNIDEEEPVWGSRLAIQALERLTRSNPPNYKAMYSLGGIYESGEIEEADPSQALALYIEAAENGYGAAMAYLAASYFYGDICEQNFGWAVYWYFKALECPEALDRDRRYYILQLRDIIDDDDFKILSETISREHIQYFTGLLTRYVDTFSPETFPLIKILIACGAEFNLDHFIAGLNNLVKVSSESSSAWEKECALAREIRSVSAPSDNIHYHLKLARMKQEFVNQIADIDLTRFDQDRLMGILYQMTMAKEYEIVFALAQAGVSLEHKTPSNNNILHSIAMDTQVDVEKVDDLLSIASKKYTKKKFALALWITAENSSGKTPLQLAIEQENLAVVAAFFYQLGYIKDLYIDDEELYTYLGDFHNGKDGFAEDDIIKARRFYQKAVELDYEPAMMKLAESYITNRAADLEQAAKWYTKAAQRNAHNPAARQQAIDRLKTLSARNNLSLTSKRKIEAYYQLSLGNEVDQALLVDANADNGQSLYDSLVNGQYAVAARLLSANASLEYIEPETGNSVLHVLVEKANHEIANAIQPPMALFLLEEFLKKDVSELVKHYNVNEYAPIEVAEHLKVITLFAKYYPTDEEDRAHYNNVLFIQLMHGNFDVSKILITAGASWACTNQFEFNVFHKIAMNVVAPAGIEEQKQFSEKFNQYLTFFETCYAERNPGAPLTGLYKELFLPRNANNQTPLELAIAFNNVAAIKIICNKLGYNNLHYAICSNNPAAVTKGINAEISPWATDIFGNSAVRLALNSSKFSCLKALLPKERLSDDDKEKLGEILRVAVASGDVALAEHLLDFGASITWALNPKHSEPLLHMAIRSQNEKMVDMLILRLSSHKSVMQALNLNKETLEEVAVRTNNLEIVGRLLAHLTLHQKHSAVEVAIKTYNLDIVELVLPHLDMKRKNSAKKTLPEVINEVLARHASFEPQMPKVVYNEAISKEENARLSEKSIKTWAADKMQWEKNGNTLTAIKCAIDEAAKAGKMPSQGSSSASLWNQFKAAFTPSSGVDSALNQHNNI